MNTRTKPSRISVTPAIHIRFAPPVAFPVSVLAAAPSGRPARRLDKNRISAPTRGGFLEGGQRPSANENPVRRGNNNSKLR